MYAIVEIAGQQFKVERGNKVYVHRLNANEGAKVEFDKVYLLDNAGKISIGSPTVEGAKVVATVIEHLKGDNVIIFKKNRRKGYQKWNGHRQHLTQLLIQGVLGKGETLKDELTSEKAVRNYSLRIETANALKRKAVRESMNGIAPVVEKKAAPKKAAAKKTA